MNILENVSSENEFRFWDGTTASNVKELYEKAKGMSPYVFRMYINERKNEFATWVEKNYSDGELKTQILGCPRKGEILDCLHKALDLAKEQRNIKASALAIKPKFEIPIINKPISASEKSEKPANKTTGLNISEMAAFFIPDKPLLSIFGKNKENKKEEKVEKLQQAELEKKPFVRNYIKPNPSKRVLMDDVVDAEDLKLKSDGFDRKEIERIAKELVGGGYRQVNITANDIRKQEGNKGNNFKQDNKSNIFKQEITPIKQESSFKAKKIETVRVSEIINRIKEVHR